MRKLRGLQLAGGNQNACLRHCRCDNPRYEKHRAAFLPAVDKLIAQMGAKILARTGSPIHLGYGGGWLNNRRMVLLEFENSQKAREWFEKLQHLPDPDNMTRHSTVILEGIEH